MPGPPGADELRYLRLVAKLGEPSSVTVTQAADDDGLPEERIVARWDLPGGGSFTFHGKRPGTPVGDAYTALLKRL